MKRLHVAITCLLLSACASAVDNQALLNANSHHISAEVTVSGTVTKLLSDSNGPDGTHERFEVNVSGLVVEVDHNVTLASRAPVAVGDVVTVEGQFEPDPGHPVVHYTHHATGKHPGGYVELNGQTYE